jgi:Gpi18-like mannosyltransferase
MILSKKTLFWISVSLLVILAVIIRVTLFNAVSDDMSHFLVPWHEYLTQYGFNGIATISSNYTVPYLYMLWAMTQLPIPAIVSIKLITILFEFIFAYVVYLIVREYYKKKSRVPILAGVGALYIPTVLVQGALWGQCDVIYITFLVLSWWTIIKHKPWLAWIFFGVALAFKLQAIFFLPFLIYWWFVNNKIQKPIFTKKNLPILAPLIAPVVVIVSTLPALLSGRSIASSVSVYTTQLGDSGTTISLGSGVNVFHLLVDVRNQDVLYLAQPAVFITMAILVMLIISYLIFNRRTRDKDTFLLLQTILLIIPFMLPYMRNRYTFAAEIFTILFAILTRRKWFIVTAILLQTTVLPRYADYLWHTNVTWDVKYLALIQLGIIIGAVYLLMKPSAKKEIIHE